MKGIKKVVVLFLTFFASFSIFASEISTELMEKIANELKKISKNEQIVITEDEVIEFEIEQNIIQIDLDLVKELENRGLLEKNVVASDGGRCIR
jgi:hypothetical protein